MMFICGFYDDWFYVVIVLWGFCIGGKYVFLKSKS